MNKLLAHQYLEVDEDNLHWYILALIHELRIVTPIQLIKLITLNKKIGRATIYRNLSYLTTCNMIDYIYENSKNSTRCYFLTRLGHQTIGGFYTFPKVPEYNLKHHLEVTNYLITSLEQVNDLDEFRMAISERRQVYEKKDMTTNQRGNSYHVADYILQFQPNKKRFEWHFEIELTLKSRRRYMKSIFPKYISLLNTSPLTHLIYVSPSPLIKTELENFKQYFIYKKEQGDYEHISFEVFERLHIFSSDNFETELSKLVTTNIIEKEGM